ncbi:NAD(P)-dependent oxidoreductase [Microbispora sp. CA-135349]|uniref:NAD(P)-dependent oxidoreductase n=1 Tax=Microbispora sp. CA-135349 TaxID=3239953 RepID=UPI003D8F8C21
MVSDLDAGLRELGPIGFVGLGNMGGPMVARLLAAGAEVQAYDTSADAVDRALAGGATRAEDLPGMADRCEIVVLMLPESSVVEKVAAQLVGDRAPGALRVLVDMSSSEPLRTQALAAELSAAGVTVLDAPVSGGVAGAETGTLTVMVGGPGEIVEEVRPVLRAVGRQVTHVGPVGAGHAVKALNNLMSAAHLVASTEALIVAARFGLDPAVVLDVVNTSSGRSGSTEHKFPRFVLPRTFNSGFTAALLKKDVGIAVGLARALEVTTPVADSVLAAWVDACQTLAAAADHTEIVRPYEERNKAVLSVHEGEHSTVTT